MDDSRYADLKASIDRGFARMDQRFDDLDVRQRKSENAIAILNDRSERERSSAVQLGGVAGGFVGGIISALASVMPSLFRGGH